MSDKIYLHYKTNHILYKISNKENIIGGYLSVIISSQYFVHFDK